MTETNDDVLDAVGPRLRALRQEHELTLAELSASTGISVSTLSRLESGQRKPTLELLLPLARVHQVQLDELVGTTSPRGPPGAARADPARADDAGPAHPSRRRTAGLQGDHRGR